MIGVHWYCLSLFVRVQGLRLGGSRDPYPSSPFKFPVGIIAGRRLFTLG